MDAREIMSRPVTTVSPGTPAIDDVGRLVGIVSEADLLIKEAEPSRTSIRRVTSWPISR